MEPNGRGREEIRIVNYYNKEKFRLTGGFSRSRKLGDSWFKPFNIYRLAVENY